MYLNNFRCSEGGNVFPNLLIHLLENHNNCISSLGQDALSKGELISLQRKIENKGKKILFKTE